MRARVVALVTFVALSIAGPAFAQSADRDSGLPDLPGMGVADRATRGEVAPSQSSKHGDSGAKNEGVGERDGGSADESTKAEPPDPGSIRELPGTGGIPIISEVRVGLTANRDRADNMPRGLFAAAALGTILSVGSFLLLRDRLLGRD